MGSPPPEQTETAFIHALSGSLSGTVADLLLHPIGTIKTRLQNQAHPSPFHTAPKQLFVNPFAGFGAVFLSSPAFGLYMAGYEMAKPRLGGSPVGDALCGVVAQCFGSLVWVPTEVIKERQQVHGVGGQGVYGRSTLHALRGAVKMEGIFGLYRGTWASLVTWLPFNMMYFPLYEAVKRRAAVSLDVEQLSPPVVYGCALSSAAFAAGITNPLDVLKTRIQVSNDVSQDYLKTVISTYRAHGVKPFFQGTMARILWLSPKHALGFTFYEYMKPHVSRMVRELSPYH